MRYSKFFGLLVVYMQLFFFLCKSESAVTKIIKEPLDGYNKTPASETKSADPSIQAQEASTIETSPTRDAPLRTRRRETPTFLDRTPERNPLRPNPLMRNPLRPTALERNPMQRNPIERRQFINSPIERQEPIRHSFQRGAPARRPIELRKLPRTRVIDEQRSKYSSKPEREDVNQLESADPNPADPNNIETFDPTLIKTPINPT